MWKDLTGKTLLELDVDWRASLKRSGTKEAAIW
jgi:hypothetical protein